MFHVCLCYSLQPYDHLLGMGWPLGSLVCNVSSCFCHFPIYGVLGQVWYLIAPIPEFCLFLLRGFGFGGPCFAV